MAKKNEVWIGGKKFHVIKKNGHVIPITKSRMSPYSTCVKNELRKTVKPGMTQREIRIAFQNAARACGAKRLIPQDMIGGYTKRVEKVSITGLSKKKKKK